MTGQTDFAALIGIDWGDKEHAVCINLPGSQEFEIARLPHDAEAIEAWAAQLRQQFDGRPVAVCLEQSRGALIYALMKYDFLTMFPINPKQSARYREAFAPSGAKDDPGDALLLCRFLREHQVQLRAWRPDDGQTRELRLLTEQRRRFVDQRTALGNQLQIVLKECYPLAMELLGKQVHVDRFLEMLAKCPSQAELQRASPKQLAGWLPKKRRVADDPPAETLQAQRIAALRAVPPLVTDRAVLDSGRLMVRHLVAMLQQLNEAVAEHDAQIATVLAKHPEAVLFAELPGAGPALRPRLVAAFGTDRERYASAADLQQFSGVAPITKRSGKSCVVQMRRACPKVLRQTFHEFARCSIGKSAWATAYYTMLRNKGHRFHAAVRALAFKWIRILHACWRNRQAYDEARHIRQLRATNSPLVAFLPAPIQP